MKRFSSIRLMPFIALLFFIISSAIYCQPHLVISTPIEAYSIDYFTGEIYYRNYMDGIIYKVDSISGVSSQSEFPSLPVFANKSHKAIYTDYIKGNAYLYDFATKTSIALPESIYVYAWPKCSFSPNDRKVVLDEYVYDFSTGRYYLDNGVFQTRDSKVVWTSDSSIIIGSDYKLLEYYPDTKRSDTLVYSDAYHKISDFSYSLSQRKLYYSISYYNTRDSIPSDFTLSMYDPQNKSITKLYSFTKSETDHLQFMTCMSLMWSPGEKLLGFIGFYDTQKDADLFVYNPDSNKVFRLTNIYTNYDRKALLRWFDDKTFFFINTENKYMYRYDIPQNITQIEIRKEFNENISLINFPNPFNSSTVISFSAAEYGMAELYVFNSIGQLVKKIAETEIEKGKISRFIWDSSDEYGRKVSSGVYYVLLRMNIEKDWYTKTLKLVLIK